MKKTLYGVICFFTAFAGCISVFAADTFSENLARDFDARVKSVVAVEFFVQREIDRAPQETIGLVVDDEGLIILNESAVPNWLPTEQFKDFKVFSPGEGGDGYDAEYLGFDPVDGYHYLRVDETMWPKLTSVTSFEPAAPRLGAKIWGIGLLGKDFDYEPYFLDGRLSLIQKLPLKVGLSEPLLGSPGGPVFDHDGKFAGWLGEPFSQDRVMTMSGGQQYRVSLRPIRESGIFLMSDEFLANLGRIPSDPSGDPQPWLGLAGMQPIDRDVAGYLGLEDQGALVLSEVLEDSPAEAGGLEDRDIVVAVDGEVLPKFRPDSVVQRYFERLILLKGPGEEMDLTVIRGDERKEIAVTIGEHPKPMNKAEREYFERLGLSVREFVVFDAVRLRVPYKDAPGVISEFVKPNSPVNTAGLRIGDWIKEIDGVEITSYEEAVRLLGLIEEDAERNDFVLLIERNNETSVLRVKLR